MTDTISLPNAPTQLREVTFVERADAFLEYLKVVDRVETDEYIQDTIKEGAFYPATIKDGDFYPEIKTVKFMLKPKHKGK